MVPLFIRRLTGRAARSLRLSPVASGERPIKRQVCVDHSAVPEPRGRMRADGPPVEPEGARNQRGFPPVIGASARLHSSISFATRPGGRHQKLAWGCVWL